MPRTLVDVLICITFGSDLLLPIGRRVQVGTWLNGFRVCVGLLSLLCGLRLCIGNHLDRDVIADAMALVTFLFLSCKIAYWHRARLEK